jgi:hypothetical protein
MYLHGADSQGRENPSNVAFQSTMLHSGQQHDDAVGGADTPLNTSGNESRTHVAICRQAVVDRLADRVSVSCAFFGRRLAVSRVCRRVGGVKVEAPQREARGGTTLTPTNAGR